jgi:hypothetical protein
MSGAVTVRRRRHRSSHNRGKHKQRLGARVEFWVVGIGVLALCSAVLLLMTILAYPNSNIGLSAPDLARLTPPDEKLIEQDEHASGGSNNGN